MFLLEMAYSFKTDRILENALFVLESFRYVQLTLETEVLKCLQVIWEFSYFLKKKTHTTKLNF